MKLLMLYLGLGMEEKVKVWKLEESLHESGATPQRVHKGIIEYPKQHFKYVDTCGCGITYKDIA